MREKEMQEYLYRHPEVLFPGRLVQERALEYSIRGRRIDLLFVVDGIRYIVELKGVPLQRDHIGQVVEYYGLMKSYFKEANLRMILVAPSVPEWRAKYLEELGIRCVELPEVPTSPASANRLVNISRKSMRREETASEQAAVIQPGDRLVWEEATSPATPRTFALARRFLRDSLETIRTHFTEYEIVPYGITRGHSHDVDLEYDKASSYGEPSFRQGGVWWAYRFGHSQEAPPNDIPNISVMATSCGLDTTVNAELRPSQEVLKQRIRNDPGRFNRIIQEHGDLWLRLHLKFEHQPRFYHWILCLRKPPGEFDAATVLDAYDACGNNYEEERVRWINRIIRDNPSLTDKQRAHLERSNRSLNLATRLTFAFHEGNPFWGMSYDGQIKHLSEAIIRLKPLLDFFVEDVGGNRRDDLFTRQKHHTDGSFP
jgi:hypothetical protein